MVACSMKGDFRGDPTRLVRPSDNMRLLETQLGHCLQLWKLGCSITLSWDLLDLEDTFIVSGVRY